jgi:hypothetical protein
MRARGLINLFGTHSTTMPESTRLSSYLIR